MRCDVNGTCISDEEASSGDGIVGYEMQRDVVRHIVISSTVRPAQDLYYSATLGIPIENLCEMKIG